MCDAMRNTLYRSALAAALLALLVAAAHAQDEARYKELPNFHTVTQGKLYRGGQPKAGGLRKLSSLGVKTVINLRGDDEHEADEEREAKSLGMRYFNVPLSLGGRPTKEQIARVLSLVNAPEDQPVFVHCHRGADRTGVVVAVYRIEHDGWTSEQALREADEYGMGWWQRGKKDFIRDYFRDQYPDAREGTSRNANQNADQNMNQRTNRKTNGNTNERRDKPSPAATKN
jgi:tyrosine-protein phosphatase SIW14